MTERQKAFAGIALCVFFWGVSFISIKAALPVYPPMSLGMLRFAIALVVLYFFRLRAGKKAGKSEKLNIRDLPALIAASVSGVTLYFFFENNGVKRVSVSEAAIITGAIPVVTMAAEALLARRSMRKLQWLGAVTSMTGVSLVSGVSLAISGSYTGYLFMTGAVICWVLYSFVTPALFSRRSLIYVVYWQTAFGFAGFVPFALPEIAHWGVPSVPVWFHITFLGLACSALGYLLYAKSLEKLGVSMSALFINFIPVISILAGILVTGDRLVPLQWLGAALTVGGVYLAAGFRR
jgi:drug/metabolite transporter (DMT)-like permease